MIQQPNIESNYEKYNPKYKELVMERKERGSGSRDGEGEATAAVLQQYKIYKKNVRNKMKEWKRSRERAEMEEEGELGDGTFLPEIERRSDLKQHGNSYLKANDSNAKAGEADDENDTSFANTTRDVPSDMLRL